MNSDELAAAFKGVKIAFGLRAQGHVPTVKRMLSESKTWDEIGEAIGWYGPTAKEFWEKYENPEFRLERILTLISKHLSGKYDDPEDALRNLLQAYVTMKGNRDAELDLARNIIAVLQKEGYAGDALPMIDRFLE